MQLRRAFPLFTLAGFLWFAAVVSAQSPTTGQITGVVKDASGAVVSGAKVTLTSAAGVQRETASDATGHYAFSLLPPGSYRVETEKAGFSKATAEERRCPHHRNNHSGHPPRRRFAKSCG